ncbi:hypothetical protein MVEN_00694300 [Mycena venus]|uniref:Uncharacterized protein n=1 Tax=Mycena venus TaxID=2733690 RepID=A0A8H6YIN1_9AGAR|nr:hypothetical protein MVEN_00694300 [Mycena venus]
MGRHIFIGITVWLNPPSQVQPTTLPYLYRQVSGDDYQLGYKYTCEQNISSRCSPLSLALHPSMKLSIGITSLLASVVSAASLQARQYNDGQLLSPAAGATVTSGSQVTIKYRVYDSIDAGTRYILVGFEYSPDDGDHYTYPVGNLSLSSPGSSGLTINSPVTAPGIGSYNLVIYDVRTAGVAQTLYSQMTVNQTITVD